MILRPFFSFRTLPATSISRMIDPERPSSYLAHLRLVRAHMAAVRVSSARFVSVFCQNFRAADNGRVSPERRHRRRRRPGGVCRHEGGEPRASSRGGLPPVSLARSLVHVRMDLLSFSVFCKLQLSPLPLCFLSVLTAACSLSASPLLAEDGELIV
eukprot:6189323-Pleurochrysis_carterae.AAC.1